MNYTQLLDTIGKTPLVKVNFNCPATILAKLEYMNPGGSIKDRTALFMIQEAERNGTLQPGGTIIEASSGNQGIAAAMIGAAKGYKVIITTNKKFSQEKINTIKAYGAEIVLCPCTEFLSDPDSYHSQAKALHEQIPNSIILNQYYNPANTHAHYSTLGPEIWQQTNGTVTHFFAATGTCGTISGVGKYLKEQNPAVKIIGVDAATSYHATAGKPKPYQMEGIGIDFDSPLLETHKNYIDEFFYVQDAQGLSMLKTMAHQHGILCGPSSGAVTYAAQEYSKNLAADAVVVMMISDSGRAYLTKNYYDKVEASDQQKATPITQLYEL